MTPSNYSFNEERTEMLDKLIDLPLKGFQEIDATPTSGITSLPTPLGNEPANLDEPITPPETTPTEFPSFASMQCPGAPRIKDLDSFTEGTGGSFDFLAGDDYCESAPVLNTLSLSLLPPPQDTSLSIELWREDVYYHSPNSTQPPSRTDPFNDTSSSLVHVKRPRSVASDDIARRTRHRSHSVVSPYSAISCFYNETTIATAQGARPRLRHSRSLPLRPD